MQGLSISAKIYSCSWLLVLMHLAKIAPCQALTWPMMLVWFANDALQNPMKFLMQHVLLHNDLLPFPSRKVALPSISLIAGLLTLVLPLQLQTDLIYLKPLTMFNRASASALLTTMLLMLFALEQYGSTWWTKMDNSILFSTAMFATLLVFRAIYCPFRRCTVNIVCLPFFVATMLHLCRLMATKFRSALLTKSSTFYMLILLQLSTTPLMHAPLYGTSASCIVATPPCNAFRASCPVSKLTPSIFQSATPVCKGVLPNCKLESHPDVHVINHLAKSRNLSHSLANAFHVTYVDRFRLLLQETNTPLYFMTAIRNMWLSTPYPTKKWRPWLQHFNYSLPTTKSIYRMESSSFGRTMVPSSATATWTHSAMNSVSNELIAYHMSQRKIHTRSAHGVTSYERLVYVSQSPTPTSYSGPKSSSMLQPSTMFCVMINAAHHISACMENIMITTNFTSCCASAITLCQIVTAPASCLLVRYTQHILDQIQRGKVTWYTYMHSSGTLQHIMLFSTRIGITAKALVLKLLLRTPLIRTSPTTALDNECGATVKSAILTITLRPDLQHVSLTTYRLTIRTSDQLMIQFMAPSEMEPRILAPGTRTTVNTVAVHSRKVTVGPVHIRWCTALGIVHRLRDITRSAARAIAPSMPIIVGYAKTSTAIAYNRLAVMTGCHMRSPNPFLILTLWSRHFRWSSTMSLSRLCRLTSWTFKLYLSPTLTLILRNPMRFPPRSW